MKIFVSHKNYHQRVTSAEKDWKNQVDGRSYFWTIVSFFLQPFLSSSSVFRRKMMECPGRKSCMCSHHGLHLLRPPWIQPLLSAQSARNWDNIESLTYHYLLEWSAFYLVAGWLHWNVSIVKGKWFLLLLEYPPILYIDLPYLHSLILPKPSSWN